ncbi:MAG TPA: DUF3097 family protein [Acidimicrobiales bacterium]|nr:DUF3097 family protein [Acidimicrobiales bacterium]
MTVIVPDLGLALRGRLRRGLPSAGGRLVAGAPGAAGNFQVVPWEPGDILDFDRRAATVYPSVEARVGLAVSHRASGFGGTFVRFDAGDAVVLRGPMGSERLFPLVPGAFSLEGKAVSLAKPRAAVTPAATASGSVAVHGRPAQVARASRILVEGVHDAELVEKVWGDDLRIAGVVVERLDGLDHLGEFIAAFRPAADARLGVLADHLVAGSKEARIAESVRHAHVLVTGTPFVDVWQAVRPKAVGITAWPVVPRGSPWKDGVCAALGAGDPRTFWRQLLAKVTSYADLEPELVGAVERLIDFVTETD